MWFGGKILYKPRNWKEKKENFQKGEIATLSIVSFVQ